VKLSSMFKNTRKAARDAGDLYYFTGNLCKNGHIAKRFSSCSVCIDCAQTRRESNRKKESMRVAEYHRRNPDKVTNRNLKWRTKNTHKVNAIEGKRRAAKMQRTPTWLSQKQLDEIEAFYEQSTQISESTGIKHHVDHIIPLQGEIVSGLHVPWNLQVISAFNNLSKHNKFEGATA